MNSSEMGAAAQAAVYASARQVTSIAHAHGERYWVELMCGYECLGGLKGSSTARRDWDLSTKREG
jgi:hypothetical protein